MREDTVERVLLAGPRPPGSPGMDLVLLDPPYDLTEDALADVLALLLAHGWLAADALVVVERSSRTPEPRWPAGLGPAQERRYGETRVWFADARRTRRGGLTATGSPRRVAAEMAVCPTRTIRSTDGPATRCRPRWNGVDALVP